MPVSKVSESHAQSGSELGRGSHIMHHYCKTLLCALCVDMVRLRDVWTR